MVEGVMGCDTKESTLLGPTTTCIGGPDFPSFGPNLESQHCLGRRSYLFDHNIHKDTEYDLG